MKKSKTPAILCFVASLLFYIAAAVSHFTSNDTSMTVVWICLGAAFLCLGAVQKTAEQEDTGDITHVIFDTDIGNCPDDLLAMQALFALQADGKCQIDAVMSSAKHRES